MGRPPRMNDAYLHYHVIVRCNNRAFRFEKDPDFIDYLSILRFAKQKHRFTLFNYELMHSHVHLFLQPSLEIPLEKTMHYINWKFSLDYNKQKGRKGHLWLARYKSIPVETGDYALRLMRYVNQNPIRAGMVAKPGEWKWSGYRFYAFGEPNELLQPHPSYMDLGLSETFRQERYRELVETNLPGEEGPNPKYSEGRFIGSDQFGLRFG